MISYYYYLISGLCYPAKSKSDAVAFLKNPQMIYAGYVSVATGKSQTGRVKRDIIFQQVPGRLNFHWVREKIHRVGFHWVCYGGTRQLIALRMPRVLSYV